MKKVLITALTVLALALSAAPAVSQTWTVRDPARDHVPPGGQNHRGFGDVIRVDAKHTRKHLVVDTFFRKGFYDEVTVYIDTRRQRPGPEFALYKTYWGTTLWHSGPRRKHFKRVACKRAFGTHTGAKTLRMRVVRTCLKGPHGHRPARLRLHLVSADETFEWTRDWVPGVRKFSPWLQAG